MRKKTEIDRWLIKNGKTVSEMCSALGIKKSSAYPILEGKKYAYPKIKFLISDYLKVEVDKLFDEKGFPLPWGSELYASDLGD